MILVQWKSINEIIGYVAPGAAPAATTQPDQPPAYTKDKLKEIGASHTCTHARIHRAYSLFLLKHDFVSTCVIFLLVS